MTTRDVAIDLTRDCDYQKLVEEEIIEYDKIEVTEDLREGESIPKTADGYCFE